MSLCFIKLAVRLLTLSLVRFLPASDLRMRATFVFVERELTAGDGRMLRYHSERSEDGPPAGEGVFLPCSFWLVDNMALACRQYEVRTLFERLLALRSDTGLLKEEYDLQRRCLLGNYPQAFMHIALINSARNLTRSGGPGEHRARDGQHSDDAPT